MVVGVAVVLLVGTATALAGPIAFVGLLATHAVRAVVGPDHRRLLPLAALWGAVMGLIFGVSGIWLNHRAVLKLPVAQQRINTQIALPDPVPATPEAMAAWLQQTLNTPEPATRTRIEKAKPVAWAERPAKGEGAKDEKTADAPREPAAKPLMQPEQWTFNFGSATTVGNGVNDLSVPAATLAAAPGPPAALTGGLRALAAGELTAAVRELAGRGEGLTPAGLRALKQVRCGEIEAT